MVQGHRQAIKLFTHEIETTQDATLKDYAKHTLPVLQSHLNEAELVRKDLKNSNSRNQGH